MRVRSSPSALLKYKNLELNFKKYHFIYKTTNIVTNTYYIGMHSTNNLDDGYLGSGLRLTRSVNKHGVENHVRVIIEFANDREGLKKRESEIVNSNEITKAKCMNLVIGGQGFSTGSAQRACKIMQLKYKDKLSEWGRSGGRANYEKNGISQKWRDKSYDWTGKKHSKSTKDKISASNKGTQTGVNNSQYGTCWITKNHVNKKINTLGLGTYIESGWIKGRTLKKIDEKNLSELYSKGLSIRKIAKSLNTDSKKVNRYLKIYNILDK